MGGRNHYIRRLILPENKSVLFLDLDLLAMVGKKLKKYYPSGGQKW